MAPISDLQAVAKQWHERRFPDAIALGVMTKTTEELGEVASAVLAKMGSTSATGKGEVGPECADVVICLLALLARWFPEVDLEHEIAVKLAVLTDPNSAHPASLPA